MFEPSRWIALEPPAARLRVIKSATAAARTFGYCRGAQRRVVGAHTPATVVYIYSLLVASSSATRLLSRRSRDWPGSILVPADRINTRDTNDPVATWRGQGLPRHPQGSLSARSPASPSALATPLHISHDHCPAHPCEERHIGSRA